MVHSLSVLAVGLGHISLGLSSRIRWVCYSKIVHMSPKRRQIDSLHGYACSDMDMLVRSDLDLLFRTLEVAGGVMRQTVV